MNKKEKERQAMMLYNDVLSELINELGNGVTSNIQLDSVGKGLFGKKYLGTFPSDLIPKSENGYAIANLDDSSKGGSHWVAVVFQNGKVYVYDSFGRRTTKILPNFKIKNIKDADYDAEQNIKEENCGPRAMSFLYVWQKMGKDYAMLI